jgi:hypothetical protein
MFSLVTIASAALLAFAGSNGRSAAWAAPEEARVQAESAAVVLADQQPTSAAENDNGPGCAEAALSR